MTTTPENTKENGKPLTKEQVIKAAQAKIDSRRNGEFTKKIDALVEKKAEAEKAVALVQAEIDEAFAKFEAGL